ncbi:rhamnan synthesis F family protein [Candidatus Avelusimicrobium caledoniensis]|uniref:rhamnan synthesis F family protein n=1 Tax=Candidatus Avelusimicrobium caledoniensis TaxID=3416220 RepID=UPI003D1324F9
MSDNYVEHLVGRWIFRKQIQQNRSCKILVILHLYYEHAWPTIKKYLRNLSPYTYDLMVTYIPEQTNVKVLANIKKFKLNTCFFPCENKGWDVAPFWGVLSTIDLSKYDIVYKLHTKGTKRKFIFIYNQIFKKKDWFYNLFNGILGGFSVHTAIQHLYTNPQVGIVAAENLIVCDPKHKQAFTKTYAKRWHIDINPRYHFVAGTCFAMKASLLQQVKKWPIVADDFVPTERGQFSSAHALERLLCAFIEPLGYQFFGQKTAHPRYGCKLKYCQKYTALRLLEDKRVHVDYEFFYKNLEGRLILYEIKKLSLGKIRREWNGKILELQHTHAYQYLEGHMQQYNDYCIENKRLSGFSMSSQRFGALILSLQTGYDETYMPVVRAEDYVLCDGQHRCCWLLKKYGPDYVIPALCITNASNLRLEKKIRLFIKKQWKKYFNMFCSN